MANKDKYITSENIAFWRCLVTWGCLWWWHCLLRNTYDGNGEMPFLPPNWIELVNMLIFSPHFWRLNPPNFYAVARFIYTMFVHKSKKDWTLSKLPSIVSCKCSHDYRGLVWWVYNCRLINWLVFAHQPCNTDESGEASVVTAGPCIARADLHLTIRYVVRTIHRLLLLLLL